MKQIAVVGIDLAKNIFQVHGTDATGHAVLTKKLSRSQVIEFFAKLTPCLIGMEACSSAHYWGRRLAEMGHTVRLMPPQYVKPYVKTNKNDARDAEAICEAVTRPNMRFVPIKSEQQQAVLVLHRIRGGIIKQRTALANQIRGLLAEFGVIVPQGFKQLNIRLIQLLSEPNSTLPVNLRQTFSSLFQELVNLTKRTKEFDKQIETHLQTSQECRRVLQIEGVGPLTATAIVASVGDIRNFKSARQFAAWLGLVPRQNSSGGKTQLLGISKRGDTYLRWLLVHGARAALSYAKRADKLTDWQQAMLQRKTLNKVVVAMAHRTARRIWAVLAKDCAYDPSYPQRSATATR
ncbi:IS110 family transposase [Nitrosomonas communis]|uniref:Transposase n=1 Tax=Nitrosomonas communis TaxID=44574 RepID=A0A1I4XRU4_9PROT|nr:IS110 family transposase [Nitrosomonas communis]SFN28507.1 transposase [Nitrosomonas communis]